MISAEVNTGFLAKTRPGEASAGRLPGQRPLDPIGAEMAPFAHRATEPGLKLGQDPRFRSAESTIPRTLTETSARPGGA